MQGKWTGSSSWNTILDPLNGEPFIKVAETEEKGIQVHHFTMKSLSEFAHIYATSYFNLLVNLLGAELDNYALAHMHVNQIFLTCRTSF